MKTISIVCFIIISSIICRADIVYNVTGSYYGEDPQSGETILAKSGENADGAKIQIIYAYTMEDGIPVIQQTWKEPVGKLLVSAKSADAVDALTVLVEANGDTLNRVSTVFPTGPVLDITVNPDDAYNQIVAQIEYAASDLVASVTRDFFGEWAENAWEDEPALVGYSAFWFEPQFGNWVYSTVGWFYMQSAPWYWHPTLGWSYRANTDIGEAATPFIYSMEYGWLYWPYGENYYYRFATNEWVVPWLW